MDGPLMNGTHPGHPDTGGPAYRLREKVRFLRDGGRPLFILPYPLKALRLHPAWLPLGVRLAQGDFVSLPELHALLGKKTGDGLRLFLDELVRKGFLETRGVPAINPLPGVSVIIPVHNRPEEIRACVESLLRIDYPADKLEILVVDDASTDHTPEAVSGLPVSLIRLSRNRQAPFCRNLGARRSSGEILAFIDSDCLADPSWLKELIPIFRDPSVAAVGGQVHSCDNRKGLDRYEQVMSSLNGGDWPRRSSEKDLFFYVPSCSLLVRKEVFLSVGGFQEDLAVGEDVDLCWRIQDQRHSIEYRPMGPVYHRHRNRLPSFCSRRFDYGTSEPLLQKRHPRRTKTFGFPWGGALFWTALFLTLFTSSWTPAILGAFILFVDGAARSRRLLRQGIPLAFGPILTAVLRDYLSLFYHGCAFLSRYYLTAGLLLIPFWPGFSIAVSVVQLLTGSVIYAVKRPRMNFLSFQFFFLLDQLSYQTGVWWGCLKNLHFRPVTPKLAGVWSQGL